MERRPASAMSGWKAAGKGKGQGKSGFKDAGKGKSQGKLGSKSRRLKVRLMPALQVPPGRYVGKTGICRPLPPPPHVLQYPLAMIHASMGMILAVLARPQFAVLG